MLKVLPSNVANLIAAGEVVQRPASVVKELVENAVDAGATTISVIIENAGKTSIEVIDDGCGMTREEAILSFQRHATSKIANAEDLESIMTYGFRGEALASIAAVAHVTMRTRKADSQTGVQVHIDGGSDNISCDEVAIPVGTRISVRDLFFNIPARRKFLKSESSEFRQIISEFSRVAISHWDLSVRLVHNGKDIYNLRKANNQKQRIVEIEGKSLDKKLIDVSFESELFTLKGFISRPEDARKNSSQYFFVNGRFFRSPFFYKAILKGYDNLIPDGLAPSFFLFFNVAPNTVDVNIHPAKTEVKFENESQMFEIITALVREALGKGTFVPSIDFEHDTLPDVPIAQNFRFPRASSAGDLHPSAPAPAYTATVVRPFNKGEISSSVGGYSELFESRSVSMTENDSIIQIFGKYIVTTVKSGLLIINIKRARERIFYEKYLKNLDDSTPISHQVLFPSSIELSPMHYSLLMENPQALGLMGFDIVPFGPFSVAVNGVPEGFGTDENSAREAIDAILAMLEDTGSLSIIKADERQRVARKMAYAAAAMTPKKLLIAEARSLVDALFACVEPQITPSGKKIMEILTEEDIDKKI